MKIFRPWLFLGIFLLIIVSCSKIEESPFPSMQEVSGEQAENTTWKPGVLAEGYGI